MVGGINPLPIVFIAWLVLFSILLVPAVLLSWNRFQAYALISLFSLGSVWYCTKFDSATILLIGLTCILSQLVGCWIQARRSMHATPTHFTPRVFAALILLLAVTLPVTIEAIKHTWYGANLPDDIPIGNPIFIPRQINVSCEIVVWNIGSQTLSQSVLKSWHTTPYKLAGIGSPTDRWLNGLGCTSAPIELRDRIIDSVNEPGSFYKHTEAAGILVASKAGLIVKFLEAK